MPRLRNIVLLGITSLLTDVSSEMVYPLVPLFLTSTLGATPAVVGLIEGVAESLASLLKVFSGYISDRLKKRRALAIVGYSSSALGKLILYLATGWGFVLVARVVDRFGKGVRTAPRDALIAESVAPERRGWAFGVHRTMDTFGATIGVLLAFYFLTYYQGEFTHIFLWSLVPAALGVAMLFGVQETRVGRGSRAELPSLRWTHLPRKLKALLAIAFLFTLGNSSNAFLLLRAGQVGFTPTNVVLLYLVYNVTYALGSYPAGVISDRIGRKPLLVTGYMLYGCVYVGFAIAAGPDRAWVLWALFGAYGVYSALTDGVEKALVVDLAPGEIRATALGVHATIVGIGLLPASLVAGQLWVIAGPAAPFLLGGITAFGAAFALWRLL